MSTKEDLKKQVEDAGKKLITSLAILTAPFNTTQIQASQTESPSPQTEHTITTNRDELSYDLKNMTPDNDFAYVELPTLQPLPQINQTLPFNPTPLPKESIDPTVFDNVNDIKLSNCRIGNFTPEWITKPQTKKELLQQIQQKRENIIYRDAKVDGEAGFYSPSEGNIKLSTTFNNRIPFSENSVYQHEKEHKRQYEQTSLGSPQTTAINFVKANTLTEKTAHIADTLNLARAMSETYKQGIREVEFTDFDGTILKTDLESILMDNPHIVKTLSDGKGGIIDFSPSNPNYKELQDKIIKASAEEWDEYHFDYYKKQEKNTQRHINIFGFNKLSFSEKINAIKNENKNYDKIVKETLKNIDIGYGETVDLTAYRDIIDTSTITANDTEFRQSEIPSREALLTINEYLISKGITSDKDKDAYLDKAFRDIVTKSPEADIKLAKIMLSDKEVNPVLSHRIFHIDGDITIYDGSAFLSEYQSNDYLYPKPQPELNASQPSALTPEQQALLQQQKQH